MIVPLDLPVDAFSWSHKVHFIITLVSL